MRQCNTGYELEMYLGDDRLNGDVAVQYKHACNALQAAISHCAGVHGLLWSAMMGESLTATVSARASQRQTQGLRGDGSKHQ